MRQIIYHSDFVSVYFDAEPRCIIWKPLDSLPSKDWKKSFEAGLQFYARNLNQGPISWLNDTRLIKAVGKDNLTWLLEYCQTLMISSPWPRIAFISPEHPLGKVAVKFYILESCKMNPGLEHGIFNDIEEAQSWLLGVKKKAA